MEFLWTPWRYKYIANLSHAGAACVFCEIPKVSDEDGLIVWRGRANYIVLNRFPYTSGHSMVIPFRHFAGFQEMNPEESAEMIALAQRLQHALQAEYHPEGYNIGWNQGKCAGAGVAGHLHLHIVPRWVGDSNLVSVIGETRVLPEDVIVTYAKLKPHFPSD